MRRKLLFLIFLLPLVGAEPAGYRYWSAADLKGYAKTLAPKMSAQKFANERIGDFGNHYALAVHREGTGDAELHENDADLMFISSGSATLVIGGSIKDSKQTAPGEQRGPSIVGGSKQKLAPGDVVHVPSKTAHQVMLDPATQITYLVVKVRD